MEQNGIQAVLHCLPPQIRSWIQQLSAAELAQVQEIRLRAERPVCIQIHGREQLLQPESVLSQKAVEQVFQAVCEYSVYRYAKEIAEASSPLPAAIGWALPARQSIRKANWCRCGISAD